MNALDKLVIEQACTALMNKFAILNDSGRFAELADLFTEDARYARPIAPGVMIEGKANIRATFESRPKERVGRHFICNAVIDVHSPERASGMCYVTLYSGNIDKPAEKFGLQAIPPQLVGEYHDEFVLSATGWKFQQRKGLIVLSA